MLPLESVPNVSEGRDPLVLERIRRGFEAAGGRVLDVHADGDHNRSVFSLVAHDDGALADALLGGIRAAVESIDLRRHRGVHPRVGAADVVPVVPLAPGDEGRAIATAHEVGRRVGDELDVPVFTYGLTGEGRRPAFFRRGGTDELCRRLETGELAPAYGPTRLHPTAGGVLVGARMPLVAFNLVLDTDDVTIARSIAEAVRGSSGGLAGVQALGLALASGSAQVSTNVIDLEVASLAELVARVRAEAEARGTTVRESELVGLVPARVVTEAARAAGVEEPIEADGLPSPGTLAAAARALALPELGADRVIEWHLARARTS